MTPSVRIYGLGLMLGESSRARLRGLALGLLSALLVALSALPSRATAATAIPAAGQAPQTFAVRPEGRWMLMRYTNKGTVLQRFTGFEHISDFALLDDSNVLVAEEEAGRLTAVGFDGRLLFETPVRRPRCLQVLAADRFLVCQDGPAAVAEIDRSGRVLWELSQPLVDAAGAARLPDGNTAVVEGRSSSHAVKVFSPDGKLLWSGTEQLAQPRGLALLPSGELVTSGFDTARIVFFLPYTPKLRTLPFCCHGDKPTNGRDGTLVIASNELQIVRSWDEEGRQGWEFSTFYPPLQGLALADGSVLVSEYRIPDRQCLNAAAAARNASAPLASYWRSLLAGFGVATLLVAVGRATSRQRGRSDARACSGEALPNGHVQSTPPSGQRRLEIGLYCAAIVILVVVSARLHARSVPMGALPGWSYAALVSAGGVLLALLQWRLPSCGAEWTERLHRSAPMARSTWPARALWMIGGFCVAFALEGVLRKRGIWVPGLWFAGVLLLAGGALTDRGPARRPRPVRLLIAAAVLAALFGLRLYELEAYPANLHQDMAQWTLQALRLNDGDVPTLFTNGWADIPMIGYIWSAVIDALGDRSVGAVRLPAAIASVLAIGAAYLLARRLYGRATAAAAALLLGVDRVFLHFSRTEAYMDPVPFHVLAVLGLIAGFETGRRAWFALAGVAGGYAALTYHAGRITPPVLVLLAAVVLARYPRVLLRRWSGVLLAAVTAAAVLGPQVMVFLGGWANAYGRSDQFVWARGEHIDVAMLKDTIRVGLPRVFGSFWLYGDSSTQYGGSVAFHPAVAALLGMAVVAAFVRITDVRGLALVFWTSLILFIGGVLTVDPPFWPRLVTALVPATILAASVVGWLYRGAVAVAGRAGQAAALVAALALVAVDARYQLETYRDFVLGTVQGSTTPVRRTQWVQSLMGRDLQHWRDAMVYIVAPNPIEHSCEHPTMEYYARDIDVRDARDIAAYLPFDGGRTSVVYVLPERAESIGAVLEAHPKAETKRFFDNVGTSVFTSVVVRPTG